MPGGPAPRELTCYYPKAVGNVFFLSRARDVQCGAAQYILYTDYPRSAIGTDRSAPAGHGDRLAVCKLKELFSCIIVMKKGADPDCVCVRPTG